MRAIAIMVIVLGAIFASGCTSNTPTTPVNESAKATAQNQQPVVPPVRYVELGLTDGSKIGGEYVSESVSFVTIIPLYVFEDRYTDKLIKGSGTAIGIKISLINTMMNISDPRPFVAEKLKEQEEEAAKREADQKAEQERVRQEMINRGMITQ